MNLLRWAQLGIAGAVVTAGLVIASADGSGAGSGAGAGGGGPGGKGFQAAFDACAKSKQGDACTFHGRGDRLVHGTCQPSMRDQTKLVCRGARGGGDGNGGGGGGGGGGSANGSGGKGSGGAKGSGSK